MSEKALMFRERSRGTAGGAAMLRWTRKRMAAESKLWTKKVMEAPVAR